jgi:nuclear GTP-binding protein
LRQNQEEKLAQKAAKRSSSRLAATSDDDGYEDEEETTPGGLSSLSSKTGIVTLPKKQKAPSASNVPEEDTPLLFDPTIPDTRSALDQASVWLHVLDARDPLAHCSSFIENRAIEEKKELVFILNKIGMPLHRLLMCFSP